MLSATSLELRNGPSKSRKPSKPKIKIGRQVCGCPPRLGGRRAKPSRPPDRSQPPSSSLENWRQNYCSASWVYTITGNSPVSGCRNVRAGVWVRRVGLLQYRAFDFDSHIQHFLRSFFRLLGDKLAIKTISIAGSSIAQLLRVLVSEYAPFLVMSDFLVRPEHAWIDSSRLNLDFNRPWRSFSACITPKMPSPCRLGGCRRAARTPSFGRYRPPLDALYSICTQAVTFAGMLFSPCELLDFQTFQRTDSTLHAVHSDLKPSAIYLGSPDRIKIADFSTATPVDESGVHDGVLGTPTFRAPGS
jgi:hypothetical protein